MPNSALPHFASGVVIQGFGRGSKELGIPTANYPHEVIQELPDSINTGVYYGWASVNDGPVYKMVLSVGWNPYYKNEKKSMETHIMHEFESDFYGSTLKICITGYIRPEKDFSSLEELINVIRNDIKFAEEQLEKPENIIFKSDPYFTKSAYNGSKSV